MNPLTVRELITVLQTLPSDAIVWVGTPYEGAGAVPLKNHDVQYDVHDRRVVIASPL